MLLAALIAAGPTLALGAEFSAYPAPVYKGPVTLPGFQGAQKDYANFRTRIRESVARGVAFGGHYAAAVIGCGAGCRFGLITDLRTGLVHDLPHGGEDYPYIAYRMRPDSRLLQTSWEPADAQGTARACALEDFAWNGKAFQSLGRRHASACPASADAN